VKVSRADTDDVLLLVVEPVCEKVPPADTVIVRDCMFPDGDALMEKDCEAVPVDVWLRRAVCVRLPEDVAVFDDVIDDVCVLVATTERVVDGEDVVVRVDVIERDCDGEAVPERVAAPELEPVAVLTSTVGEILPVGLPDGEDEVVRDATCVRVKEGEPEGLRDERPDLEKVGVPVDVLLDETEPEDVLELVVVLDTDDEPVMVLETRPVLDSTGDRDADFEPADERVAVRVDVAVLLDTADCVVKTVPKLVDVDLVDLVEVFEGKPEDVAKTATSTRTRSPPPSEAKTGAECAKTRHKRRHNTLPMKVALREP